MLDDKYGTHGTETRNEFDEQSLAWFDCCDICHKTPCECSDNNDNNSGNSEGSSSGSSGSSGGGGGTSIGGGNSNNSSSSTSHITSKENLRKAASGSVEQMKNKYGLEMAVCNFGVQTMFKAIFGDTDLPPGMSGRANDMVTVWENHPDIGFLRNFQRHKNLLMQAIL